MRERAPRYAVFGLDTKGRITSWNSDAEQMKGYRADEVIGEHFSIFYPPGRVKTQYPDAELAWAATQGFYIDQGWRVRKDGSQFFAHVFISAQYDTNGTLTGFIKVVRNEDPPAPTP